MAIELKQSLKLSQQLVITPQLQQAIKLLQLSRLELTDLIQNELLENPILEEGPQAEEEEVSAEIGKEIEAPEALDKSHEQNPEMTTKDGNLNEPKDFEWENYIGSQGDGGDSVRSFAADEAPAYENIGHKTTSLHEHLEWQLRMSLLSSSEDEMAYVLIDYIDDNGYLGTPLQEISQKEGYPLDELEEALSIIQEFDPMGVGARDLRECLLLQARVFKQDRALLETLIKEHLSLLEKRDFPMLARKLKIPMSRVADLARIITEMEPKPGRSFGRSDTLYVTPDVYVYKVGADFAVVLNEDGLPRLRVSNYYKDMNFKPLADGKDKAKDYVQDKLKSAMWLIKSLHQRQRTLYRVSKCIVKFQREFFENGINFLKPMILRDVAEEIGVHESTVSRATTHKYMHTPQGIFELKYFFNSGISVSTGQDVASETVKDKIRCIVADEDVKKPLSDKDIVVLLKEGSNIDIARRTVAKYREMLGILPSSKRRHLY